MPDNRAKMDRVYRHRALKPGKYSLDNPGNQFNFRLLRERINDHLHSAFGDPDSVQMLDLGAGELFWADQMRALGIPSGNVVACDLLHWRLAKGRREGREIDAVNASAEQLPFPDRSFDLVCQFTLMTSILEPGMRQKIAAEMLRVLKPGGYILWYDFRYQNPFNRHTRAIGLTELIRLFSGLPVVMEEITLIPQVARRSPRSLIPLLKWAYRLPILRTHYLALIGPKG
jgi:ubiquinone/menaquinone biosynthesis C-methylase UbiE